MTLYLVKHAEEDYRLHRNDGTELVTYSWSFDWLTPGEPPFDPKSKFASDISDSVMSDQLDVWEALAGNYNYRDKAAHGSDEVPWST